MVVATEPFQVVPYADGIRADDELFPLVLSGYRGKFSCGVTSILKKDIKPRRRILPNGAV